MGLPWVRSTHLKHEFEATRADLLIRWLSRQLLGRQRWAQSKTKVLGDVGDRSRVVQVCWTGGQPQMVEGDSGRLAKGKMIQEKVKPQTLYELLFLVNLSPFVISTIYSLTFLLSVMRVFKGLNSSLYAHRKFFTLKKNNR